MGKKNSNWDEIRMKITLKYNHEQGIQTQFPVPFPRVKDRADKGNRTNTHTFREGPKRKARPPLISLS